MSSLIQNYEIQYRQGVADSLAVGTGRQLHGCLDAGGGAFLGEDRVALLRGGHHDPASGKRAVHVGEGSLSSTAAGRLEVGAKSLLQEVPHTSEDKRYNGHPVTQKLPEVRISLHDANRFGID